jgi:hypothetical protein
LGPVASGRGNRAQGRRPTEEDFPMSSLRTLALAAGCLLLAGVGAAHAQNSAWLKGSTDEKFDTLANLQPGLGTVMMEYSSRFTSMYYAAQGGNWELADYHLKEMTEIQEVGEATRPARAKALKKFEDGSLGPLGAAIKAKDFKQFETAFESARQECNNCHADQGFKFIRYELPKASPSPLSNKP